MKYLPYVCSIVLYLLAYSLKAQCPSATALDIDTIITSESRCQNTGAATVYATGGSAPYLYSIIAGPSLTGLQSGNTFRSLPAGNYTVSVVDICNTRMTKSFVVQGSYQVPLLAVTVTPPGCNAPSTGALTISVENAGSRAPFTYSLISPSPVIRAPQRQGMFSNLTAGIYSGRVTDSCGNFQTVKTVIPPDQTGVFSISTGMLIWQNCDTYALPYMVQTQIAANAFPYTAVLTLANGVSYTHILNSAADLKDTFLFPFHHRARYLDTYSLRITNACGFSLSKTNNMSLLDLNAQPKPVSVCSGQNAYTVDAYGDGSNASTKKLHCQPLTYTLINPSGTVVATQTNNAVFTGFPAGIGYKVIRTDCCGKDSLTFDWLEQSPFKINGYQLSPLRGCKEGAVSVNLSTTSGSGTLVLVSGPPSVSFSDGTAKTYTYPDTLKNVGLNSAINYFTTGTYKIMAIDLCGNKDSIIITILPSNLLHADFSVRMERGCSNTNRIIWSAQSNGYGIVSVAEAPEYRGIVLGAARTIDTLLRPAGTYHTSYQYQIYGSALFLKGMNTIPCDIIKDSVVIPLYTQPLFTTPAVAVCGTNRTVSLIPDTMRGVAPYQYQLTAPVAGALQSSPEFKGLAKGTYVFLMTDACGNSYSSNITIDTLLFPSITLSGNACTGNGVIIGAPDLPGYAYDWEHPDGTHSYGSSIVIDSVAPEDTGTYRATITTSIGSCTNKHVETFKLDPCVVLPMDLIHFEGTFRDAAIQLTWQTVNEKNTRSFIIEKSNDGKTFHPFREIQTSGQSMNLYNATDTDPYPGVTYYRLKLMDLDGSFSYSATIPVIWQKDITVTLWPNPVQDLFTIEWMSAPDMETHIEIADVKGNIVWARRVISSGHITTEVISARSLTEGMYVVKLIQNNSIAFIKFIKI